MSPRRIGMGVFCVAVIVGLTACGSTRKPTIKQSRFSEPFLTSAAVQATFRAHGILLQKTFGDTIQASYDGISSTSLGLHIVGLIIYPPPRQDGNHVIEQSGGVGDPIVIANVSVWVDPGLPSRFRAEAEAAISALRAKCHCENAALSLLPSMVVVRSGDWSGHRWTLRGADLRSREYCVSLTTPESSVLRAGGCGTIFPLGPANTPFPQNISVGIGQGRLLPDSVFGVVVSAAATIQIRFTNGTTETVAPIPPPPALRSGDLDFYIARRPCGATYASIVARDANGKIVARAVRRRGPYALEQNELC